MIEDRQYQIEAKNALIKDIKLHNPLIAIPTGAGKTIIMSKFIQDYLKDNPEKNILIVAPMQEIIEQDYKALCNFFSYRKVGLYCQGLKSKTIRKITVASIQSIYNKSEHYKHFDLVFVDECHTVSFKQTSRYRKFFAKLKPGIKIVGMSATIFRSKGGYLHEGKDRIFNKLSYDLTSESAFNNLVDSSYLCNLISKPTKLELNTKKISTTGGDFNLKELSAAHDREEITKKAIQELTKYGKYGYKSWLVFAIDIKHANHIYNVLKELNYKVEVLHSKNSENRKRIIRDFKAGKFQILVSVGMITTGFDAPNVDLIALLRATKSPVLHVQMIGRGLRVAPGKKHCLILDFAGNIRRLGPINNINLYLTKRKKKGKGGSMLKVCPRCNCYCSIAIRICPVCKHIFKIKPKIHTKPDNIDVVSKNDGWLIVLKVLYEVFYGAQNIPILKVTYKTNKRIVSEFVCLEHTNYAGHIARNWVYHRWPAGESIPQTIKELFSNRYKLKIPVKILVEKKTSKEKYDKIKDVSFEKS